MESVGIKHKLLCCYIPGVNLLRRLLFETGNLQHFYMMLVPYLRVCLPMNVMRGSLIAQYVSLDRNCGGRLLP